jgi:hypothetical protein
MTINRLAAVVLALALTGSFSQAETSPPACASLCGEWRLDESASDRPEQQLDAAFQQFKEPRAHRASRVFSDNIEALGKAADEEALGPILDRPRSAELRAELRHALRQPGFLKISGDREDIRIAGNDASQLTVTPGDEHARVDQYGTARIQSRWRDSRLTVGEKYDRRNRLETTYGLDRDGTLRISQVVTRPGLPRVTVRSVYRRP